MTPSVSVILCTHNPRADYLAAVIHSLRIQTLPLGEWELLVVDNASETAVGVDLSWHANARVLREETLGLVHARRMGVHEARGELLVFVDDDNVLGVDYLREAVAIARQHPEIGAFGGQIAPRFEIDPPAWTQPYWPWLAIRLFTCDRWSNQSDDHAAMPCGAGMCVRRVVVQRWVERLASDPNRTALGRTGTRLLSGEDSDLAWTACDMGLGVGVFTALKMTHLIPARRLQESYILELVEGTAYSNVRLMATRGPLPTEQLPRQWLALAKAMLRGRRNFRFALASYRGRCAARRDIAAIEKRAEVCKSAAVPAAEA